MDTKIKVNDTISIPSHLNDGRQQMGKVIGVYPNFILVQKENGVKISISSFDIKDITIVIKDTGEANDNEFENIIAGVSELGDGRIDEMRGM